MVEQKDQVITEATQALFYRLGRRPDTMTAYLHPGDMTDLIHQVWSLRRALIEGADTPPPTPDGQYLVMHVPAGSVTIKPDPTMPEGKAKLCSPLDDGTVAEVDFSFSIDEEKSPEVSESSFASAFQNFVDGSQASDAAQPFPRMKVNIRRRVDVALEAVKRGQQTPKAMTLFIAARSARLSLWERKFIRDISYQLDEGRVLSSKQEKVLAEIYGRIAG